MSVSTIGNRPAGLLTADRLLAEAVVILENEIDPATDAIERSICNLAIVLFMVLREVEKTNSTVMLISEIAESGGRVLKSHEQTLVYFVIAGRNSRQHLFVRFATIAVLEALTIRRAEFKSADRRTLMDHIEKFGSVEGIIATRRRVQRARSAESARAAEIRRRTQATKALERAAEQAGHTPGEHIRDVERKMLLAEIEASRARILDHMPMLIAEGVATEILGRRPMMDVVTVTFQGRVWLINPI